MSRMKWNWIVGLATLPALAAWTTAGPNDDAKGPKLEWLKPLVGTWVSVDEAGRATDEVVSIYRETAAGSAIIETLFPGSDHEMVTLYHMDGADLVLTHYCSAGNQPRMVATADSTASRINFKCATESHRQLEKELHMHQATIHLIDQDNIRPEWISFDNGAATAPMPFVLKRKS